MISDDYLAGLFDGEGYIELRISKDKKTVIAIGVGMQCDLPYLFKERFGGEVYLDNWNDSAKATKRSWKVSGRKAREALEVFSVKCRFKNLEAGLALQMIELLGQPLVKVNNWPQRKALVEEREKVREELYCGRS